MGQVSLGELVFFTGVELINCYVRRGPLKTI